MILEFKKTTIQIKSVIITIILTSLLYFSNLYASDINANDQPSSTKKAGLSFEENPSFFKKASDTFYYSLTNHEYLITPLAGAIAGTVRCKDYNTKIKTGCIAIGGILGAFDEIAMYFGFTDMHYLTWGIFGAAMGRILTKPFASTPNVVDPFSIVSDFAGVTVGILLPTGMLNDHKNIIAPIISSVAGGSMLGTAGLIGGGVMGVLDEVLLSNNVTDKHYITFSNIGIAATNILGYFNPSVSSFIGAALGLIATNYEQEISNNLLAPIETANNLYTVYNKFIPKEQLDTSIEKQALALVGGQFLTQLLSLKVLSYRQGLLNAFPQLEHPNAEVWDNFRAKFTYFSIFIFPYFIGQTISNSIDNYFCKKLHFDLEDKIFAELFSGETALRLSYDKNATVPMDKLSDDISTAVYQGSGLVTNTVSTAINGGYGLGVIIVTSPNILIYSALYYTATSEISKYLARQRRFYEEKITALKSKRNDNFKNDIKDIRSITERGGIEVTKNKIQQISTDLREYNEAQKLWDIATNVWGSITLITDWMTNYYLLVNEINNKKIPFKESHVIQQAGWKVSDLFAWSGRHAQNMESIDQALDHVIILEGKIYAQSNKVDQITRTILENDNKLTLQNVEVGFGNTTLVTVENLALEMGKIYAITGSSGSGKTRLLYKIKGIKTDGSYSKGNIQYPSINGKEPKIIMVSQQDYFPLDSSLQEIISYPDKTPDNQEENTKQQEKILILLKDAFNPTDYTQEDNEMGHENKNEEKPSWFLDLKHIENWHNRLSGGEKKKIIIISAIIKNPDILILDEAFNGLDRESIITIQKMLKKYLPNSMILIVDHHAMNNNYDSFYDEELHFSKKTKTITTKKY